MFSRKVQKTGGSTYFVTLPKEWATKIGISQGSIVTLMPNDSGSLLLVPESLSQVNRCTIELQDWDFDRACWPCLPTSQCSKLWFCF